MAITVNLIKRSEQASPLSASQFDANMTAIETAFNLVPTSTDGTVESVGLVLPNIFTVTVSPITTSGILTAVLANQSANLVFAGPTSSSSTPTFRALVNGDLPVVGTDKGGTGKSTIGTSLQLLRTNSAANALEYATIEAGSSKVTVTNGATISIDIVENQISRANLIGITPIAGGGTNASTAQGGRLALLPSITGNAGKALVVNGGETDAAWSTITGAIASVNSLTGALTIAVGTTGTDVAVASSGTNITINIPSASASNRGVITTAAQTIAGIKTFSAAPIVPITDTYIMYSNSGEVSGSAAFVVDAAKEQMQVKRSIITERQVALGFNDTYHTTNQTVAPERDYILYFDTSGGSLDCTMFDTTNPSAEIGSLYKIVKTTAANNLVIKVQGSDSIGTLATTTYTLTGVKGWVEVQFVKSGLFSILSTGTIS